MSRRNCGELLKSRALLTLVDSFSTVGVPSAQLSAAIASSGVSVSRAQFLCNYLVVGTASGEDLPEEVIAAYPNVVVFDTTGGELRETARLPSTAAASNVYISESAKRPLVIREQFTQTEAFGQIYRVTQAGGLTLFGTINYLDIEGAVYDFNVGIGLSAISHDGKYAIVTVPTALDEDLVITSAVYVVLRINPDGTTEEVARTAAPIFNGIAVSSIIGDFVKTSKKGEYVAVLQILTIDANGAVETAGLASFRFNARREELFVTGTALTGRAVTGIDIHPDLDRVIVSTNQVDVDGITNRQVPFNPFASAANVPRVGDEIRLYALSACANRDALKFLKGTNIDQIGVTVRWSNKGDKLAAVVRVGAFVPSFEPGVSAAAPNTLLTFQYDRCEDALHLEDQRGVAPLAAGVAWSNNDKLLAVAGIPTAIQRDILLYDVSANECKH